MRNPDSVIIKGVRDGLLLIVDDDVPFAHILTELSARIAAQPTFFKGAAVTINIGRRIIEGSEFDVLYKMFTRNGMRVQTVVSLSAQSRMVAENYGVTSRPPSFAAGDAGASLGLKSRGSGLALPNEAVEGSEVGTGLFLRCTLRHGQSVRYAGDVCVLGDVEIGAEIIAEGDIVVWGSLRGVVHAGVGGDDEAVVCALQMCPTQIGIAGLVSRFPSDSTRYQDSHQPPELARIEQGGIVVEAWG